MTTDDSTMRDAFDAAFDEYEGEPEANEKEEVQARPDSDGDEGEIQATTGEDQRETESEPLQTEPNAEATGEPVEENPEAGDTFKPPAGWKPSEREGWANVPVNVKQAIDRREKEMDHNLRVTAQARNIAKNFHETMMPYKPMLDAEGVNDPIQAVQGLMRTAATMRMGNPQQKAQEVATIIKNYGVDISTLDSLLAGETPQNAPDQQIQQLLDQRLAPVDQLLQQINQQNQYQEQQTRTEAGQQIAKFSEQAEFLNDVRHDMADLMDMAAKRGQVMSMEDAYNKAVALNPEISQVVSQRQRQTNLQNAAQVNGQKRHAASSISGRMAGNAPRGDLTLRQQLEESWSS